MTPPQPFWQRALWPLHSRKVQVAIAAIIVAYAARRGWVLDEEAVTQIVALAVALILGIAHEDGRRARSGPAE